MRNHECRVKPYLLVGSTEETKVRSVCCITVALFFLNKLQTGVEQTVFSLSSTAHHFIRTFFKCFQFPCRVPA